MELNIGGAIRRLRRERDVTQDELASAIGVTAQAVSKWERSVSHS
ncbi:MAG: helix-turn-helix transcriptional regulator [Clostridia bacterium]|nr:helix-turn-helix transcriptional regulator [Clostridia bacterium]